MFKSAIRLPLQSYIPFLILGILVFPLSEGHEGAPWQFYMLITDACVFHRKLNDAATLHNRALDPHLNKPQHCLATEIRLWVEAVYSREVVVTCLF